MDRFYAVNDAATGVKPVRPGGPPVYVAGQADVSVRRAARDRRCLAYRQYQARQSDRIDADLSRALEQCGRKPMEFPITVECYVGANHTTAQEECHGPLEYKCLCRLAGEPHGRGLVRGVRARPVHYRRQGVGQGRNRPLSRASGCRSLHHALPMAGLPQKRALASTRRLGEIFASESPQLSPVSDERRLSLRPSRAAASMRGAQGRGARVHYRGAGGADLEKYISTGAGLNQGEAGAASRQRRTKEKAP
jgi:alkanesulfonate monooxygenase SsuD/methylene tetrahydromethanopterin reductase-like flavin-dependent oxidoreductase (luciferase family)